MTAEVPAASEQRAALTEAERAALWDSIERAFLDTTTWNQEAEDNIDRAVERILADRAAAEDHGLRARLLDLAADFESEIDWSSGRSNYGDNAAWESAARQLRAAIGDDGRGGGAA